MPLYPNAAQPYIVLVEVERQLVMRLRFGLRQYGVRVEAARTQEHALFLLERERPDALYLSEPLLRGNGGDVMTLIDRDQRLDDVPILLRVSELASVWAHAMRRGGLQTVAMPFSVAAVAERLGRMSRGDEGRLRALVNNSRQLHGRSRQNRQRASVAQARLQRMLRRAQNPGNT